MKHKYIHFSDDHTFVCTWKYCIYIYILNLAVGNYLKAEAVIGQLSFGRSLKK